MKYFLIFILFLSSCARSQPAHVVIKKDKSTYPPGTILLLGHGNSLMAGNNCCTLASTSLGNTIWTTVNTRGNYTFYNKGVGGRNTTNCVLAIPTDLDPYYDDNTWTQIIVVIIEGVNSIHETGSGTFAYNKMMEYRDSVLASDPRTFLAVYMIPACTPTFLDTNQITIYNNLLAGTTQTTRFKVIDIRNTPELHATTAYTNTTYFDVDMIHLNATGYALLASIGVATVRGFGFEKYYIIVLLFAAMATYTEKKVIQMYDRKKAA